jgi:hypothetical protein
MAYGPRLLADHSERRCRVNFTNKQLGRWAKEAAEKAVEWARVVNPALSPEAAEAYRAGVLHGFGEAVAALKFHGAITESFGEGRAA